MILAALVPSGVGHIDSVKFRDKTYHLAGEYTFDDLMYKTVLCECDSTGYWCECHHLGEVGVSEQLWVDVDRSKNQIIIYSPYEGTIYRYNIPSP